MPRPARAAADAEPLSEKVSRLDLDGGEGPSGSSEGDEENAAAAVEVTPGLAGKLPPSGEAPSVPHGAGSSGPRAEDGVTEPLRRNEAAVKAAASAAAAAKAADSVSTPIGDDDEREDRADASPFAAHPPPRPPSPLPPALDGQPQACSFFLKTATCAFGSKCRFAHPVDQAPPIRFNVLGLPLRPAEPPCA